MFYTIFVENTRIKKGEKIIFYANTEENILLDAEQFENLVREKVDMDDFDIWLDENYRASEVINESSKFYDNLTEEFIEDSIEIIRKEMLDEEWIEVEYTIE